MTLIADGNGRMRGKFTVPANLPAGVKRVLARGQGGTAAATVYVGTGTIETQVLQRLFTTRLWRDLPPPPPASPAPETSFVNDTFAGLNGGNDGGGFDPQAQTFRLDAARHITSVDLKLGGIGNRDNPLVVQIREVALGAYPTAVVLGEGVLDMHQVAAGQEVNVPLRFPTFVRGGVDYAIVILTDDPLHELAVAERGKYDPDRQQWVTSNPLENSVNLDSSTQTAWVPHHDRDLWFRLRGARFTATTRRVEAGQVQLDRCTDLVVRAGIDLPAADTAVLVEITRANGAVLRVQTGQPVRFDAEVSETIALALILSGTALHAPTVYPQVQIQRGRVRASGDYVSRAVPAGPNSRVTIVLDCMMPGASGVAVEVGHPGAWQPVPVIGVADLGEGAQERTFEVATYSAETVQMRVSLNGTPAHRPSAAQVRMHVTAKPLNISA